VESARQSLVQVPAGAFIVPRTGPLPGIILEYRPSFVLLAIAPEVAIFISQPLPFVRAFVEDITMPPFRSTTRYHWAYRPSSGVAEFLPAGVLKSSKFNNYV
jgi:hypothetical protein